MTRDELVKTTTGPKVLPFVAKKVLEMAQDEDVSIAELCTIVEKDQTITASILKIANSAFYGLRQDVTSLRQAVMVLGLTTLRDLVVTVSTRLQYKKFGITEQLLWDHAVGTAIAARLIARGLDADLQEIAFLGGLMHDFGKVVMNNECPDAFLEVMQSIYNEGHDFIDAEEAVFGYNHADVGSLVITEWGFPPVYLTILKGHHLTTCSLDEIAEPFTARAVACIHLADNCCKTLGIGYRVPDESIQISHLPSAVLLNIPPAEINNLLNKIGTAYETEKTAFQ